MQLRWEHIDERVVRRVHAHMVENHSAETVPNAAVHDASGSSGGTQTTAMTAHEPDGRLEAVWSVFAASVAFFVVALYSTVCFHITGPFATLALLGLPLGTAFATWLPSGLAARAAKTQPLNPPALRGRIAAENDGLRQAFAQAARTRAESLYGEVVLLLSEPPQNAALHSKLVWLARGQKEEGQTVRLLLGECNALLAHSFRLETETRRISELWKNGETITNVEAERFALLRKMDDATDPLARQSLMESVALCDERLEGIRAYPTLLARLDAHQEVVCQSLALVAGALARSQAAPHALHAPDVRGLRAALRGITHQTQAVEDAVLEITGDPRP